MTSRAQRRDALRATAAERGLDAVLVTNLLNVRYLTGFTGSNGALVVGTDGFDLLCTDERYERQAMSQASDVALVTSRAILGTLAADMASRNLARTGFESHHLTVDAFEVVRAAIKMAATSGPGPALVPTPGLVETMRMQKEAIERASITNACDIADRALWTLMQEGGLRPGRTELEVARELNSGMLELGADSPSFETIVATGANSAMPHHRPDLSVLSRGDFVKIDFGAMVDGYHSDMTRTFVLGRAAPWQRQLHDLVRLSLEDAIAVAASGTSASLVYRAATRRLIEANHARHTLLRTGHGIGLAVHEHPILHAEESTELNSGMVLAIEPGVYLPGRGGVRIEDTVEVRSGPARPLCNTTKDLIEL